jgi:multidrug resistance efflux pump
MTNMRVQLGDFMSAGQKSSSLVSVHSLWVDGPFEETNLRWIRERDLLDQNDGPRRTRSVHVESIARGINMPNAQPESSDVASVNPIFTRVRLAQRVAVVIYLDNMPKGDCAIKSGMCP